MASERGHIARVDALSVRSPSGRSLLTEISLSIALPSRVAVMGANGAGKSVLLGALAGVVAHEGAIDLPEPRAAVLQDPEGVFAAATVEEEIAFALACRGLDEGTERARVEAALAAFGLARLAHRDPASLSGGEQQRVHLAAAIVTEPGTLLLDEPTEFLDLEAREAIEARLASLDPAPRLVVRATHDVEHALTSDLLVILQGGRVATVGAPVEVLRRAPLGALGIEVPPALTIARALAGRVFRPLPLRFAELERCLAPVERR